MARPVRSEYAGAYCQVRNRGNRRQVVCAAPPDQELFRERLGRFAATFGATPVPR